MKVPSRSSRAARCSWACVFITIGRRVPEAVSLRRAETGSFFAGLDRYLIATVEENERAIAGALADQGFAAIDFLFGTIPKDRPNAHSG